MSKLSAKECEEFTKVASAFLATRERIELMKEQAAEQLGGHTGHVPLPNTSVDPIMEKGYRLRAVLADINEQHSDLPAIRFRGNIFHLDMSNGKVLILQESEIETVP